MSRLTKTEITTLVDNIGVLDAEIAELEKQRSEIAGKLKKLGEGSYDGSLFTATVSSYVRNVLDGDIVRKYLTPLQLKRATKVVPVVSLKTSSRIVRKAA